MTQDLGTEMPQILPMIAYGLRAKWHGAHRKGWIVLQNFRKTKLYNIYPIMGLLGPWQGTLEQTVTSEFTAKLVMYQSPKNMKALFSICLSWEVTNQMCPPTGTSTCLSRVTCRKLGCDKAIQTDTQIWCAYPPRLLSNRRWGKVKGIYQRKGKKKNNINKAAENSHITYEQNPWVLATSLKATLCSLAVRSACACPQLFA